jgi:hypothetical protein
MVSGSADSALLLATIPTTTRKEMATMERTVFIVCSLHLVIDLRD